MAPARLVVKVHVGALLVLVRGDLGLLVPLEPGEVLLVVPPALLLELPRGEVLLVGALLVVEDEEECQGLSF